MKNGSVSRNGIAASITYIVAHGAWHSSFILSRARESLMRAVFTQTCTNITSTLSKSQGLIPQPSLRCVTRCPNRQVSRPCILSRMAIYSLIPTHRSRRPHYHTATIFTYIAKKTLRRIDAQLLIPVRVLLALSEWLWSSYDRVALSSLYIETWTLLHQTPAKPQL